MKVYYSFLSILLFFIMSTGVFAAFTVQDELEMGAVGNAQVQKMFVPTKDESKQKELEEIGKKLVAQCDRHDYEYEFHVGTFVGKDGEGYNLNAFAMPGGYVYFGEALWDIMNHDERAGIIAHEVTHVDRKHSLKQQEKNQLTTLGLSILLGVAHAGNLANIAAGLLQQVMSNNYSISDEREADKKGTEKLIKAGLNPCGVLNSMEVLQRMENGTNNIPDFLLDHPKTQKRIEYLTSYLKDKKIEIVNKEIKYSYPKDKLGIIKEVERKNNKYKKITLIPNENIELKKGDVVYIDKFSWDSKYEYLVPISIFKAEVEGVMDDGTYSLVYKDTLVKTKEKITEKDVVAKSAISPDFYKPKETKNSDNKETKNNK